MTCHSDSAIHLLFGQMQSLSSSSRRHSFFGSFQSIIFSFNISIVILIFEITSIYLKKNQWSLIHLKLCSIFDIKKPNFETELLMKNKSSFDMSLSWAELKLELSFCFSLRIRCEILQELNSNFCIIINNNNDNSVLLLFFWIDFL
jgi:hypothetical protein